MASRNLDAAVRVFASLDTTEQATVLHRVGLETDLADRLLGYVKGMYPDRAEALEARLSRIADGVESVPMGGIRPIATALLAVSA